MRGQMWRRSGRPGGKACDARWRRQSPGGRGRSGRKSPAFREPMAADQPRGVERGCWWVGGRRRIQWGRGRGAPRKAAVREDDGSGGGGGHDNDDGGGWGTKKWLCAGGGGSLLLYIVTSLVSGRVTNCDKRGAFCHGWWYQSTPKGDFARESQKGKFPSLVPGGFTTRDKRPPFCLVVTPPGLKVYFERDINSFPISLLIFSFILFATFLKISKFHIWTMKKFISLSVNSLNFPI
jgi:hypothetical protein